MEAKLSPDGADYPFVWPRIGEKLGHIALGSSAAAAGARAGRQEACIITGATQPPRSVDRRRLTDSIDGVVRFGRTFNFGGNAEKRKRDFWAAAAASATTSPASGVCGGGGGKNK